MSSFDATLHKPAISLYASLPPSFAKKLSSLNLPSLPASGCVSSKEFTFRINGESGPSSVIPNIIKLSGMNPYWNIPDEYKNANTKVMIISSNGDMVLDVVNYQGDWPQSNIDFKNVNPVYYYVIQSDTGEKKGSITVIK